MRLRRLMIQVVTAIVLLVPTAVHADAVDEAFASGNRAAAAQDWAGAAQHYGRANQLLPGMNATLAYNLGTTHANLGDLGRATYWLRRALQTQGGPTPQIVELARANLAEVRRRAELAATAAGNQIDRPATWWDLLLEALGAAWVGWASLVAGVGFLVVWALERRRASSGGPLQAMVLVFAIAYVTLGALHGLALRADAVAPPAIVLGDHLDVRERPGAHAESTFTIQGGARVRIMDRTPGWQLVRLPGGLSGWVPDTALGHLSSARGLGNASAMNGLVESPQ